MALIEKASDKYFQISLTQFSPLSRAT